MEIERGAKSLALIFKNRAAYPIKGKETLPSQKLMGNQF
jgi:hypothetical protein